MNSAAPLPADALVLQMAASGDERLRKQLSDLGYNAGPITDTTRHIYVKKLVELQETKKRNSRRSVQPKSLNSRSLLTFSSDESDPESIDAKGSTRKLRRRNRLSLPATDKTLQHTPDRNKNNVPLTPNSMRHPNYNNISNRKPSHNFFDSSETDSDYTENMNDLHASSEMYSNKNRNISPNAKYNSMLKNKDGKKYDDKKRKDFSINGGHQKILFSGNSNISSHCISMILLSIVILFFIVIGVMYLSVRSKEGKDLPNRILQSPAENYYDKMQNMDEDCKLVVLNHLRNKLRQIAGVYDCSSKDVGMKRSMHLSEVEKFVRDLPSFINSNQKNVKKVLFECLEIFLKHPDFGIRLYNSTNEPLTEQKLSYSNVHFLESVSGEKSFYCRLTQAFGLVLYKLMLLMSVLICLVIVALIGYWHWHQKKKFHKEMLSLIENIMTLLQNNDEASINNPEVKSYLPIPHVRDMLIPLSERKQKKALWDAAVKFIHDNDSRIRVECQNVDGEDYQVWRWLQPPSPTRTSPIKKWQGQAFENLDGGTNSPPYSLTSCLKVRNMFDPDVEYGNDWHVHIQDAILEKCDSVNGIVHIKVDTSSREGCVYVKCTNPETAGQVFRALHGWWFDGSLVTVRYLRLERYHERFPKALHAKEPLRPSNKKPMFGLS